MRRLCLVVVLATMGLGILAPKPAHAATLMKLKATLLGSVEQPAKGDPHGRGTATFNMYPTRGRICYTISVSFIKLPALAAHIHAGKAGVEGPIVVPLTAPNKSGKASGCVSAKKTLISAIDAHPSSYYVNVHTAKYPNGAVRGQLGM